MRSWGVVTEESWVRVEIQEMLLVLSVMQISAFRRVTTFARHG